MSTTRVISRSGRPALAFVLMLLVGCGGATTTGVPTSPSEQAATASPGPSATDAPIDIGEEFVRLAVELDTFRSEVSGTMRVAAAEGVISGETQVVDSNVSSRMLVEFPGLPEQRTESITVDGVAYDRIGDGYWLQAASVPGAPRSAGSADAVSAAFASAGGLKVVGTEEYRGQTLHRLESSLLADFSPEDLGFSDELIANFSSEVAFLAEDDGTPAGIIFSAAWVQETDAQPVDVELELRFMLVDRDLTIEAPADPWILHESAELGYRMAQPANWDFTHNPATADLLAWDLYLGPVDGEVQVYRYTDLAGTTANQWFRESAQLLFEQYNNELELDIMTLPSGLDAHVFVTKYTDGAETILFQQAVVFGGDVAWDINWYSVDGNLAGTEAEDRATFLQFVTSFEPSAH